MQHVNNFANMSKLFYAYARTQMHNPHTHIYMYQVHKALIWLNTHTHTHMRTYTVVWRTPNPFVAINALLFIYITHRKQ